MIKRAYHKLSPSVMKSFHNYHELNWTFLAFELSNKLGVLQDHKPESYASLKLQQGWSVELLVKPKTSNQIHRLKNPIRYPNWCWQRQFNCNDGDWCGVYIVISYNVNQNTIYMTIIIYNAKVLQKWLNRSKSSNLIGFH